MLIWENLLERVRKKLSMWKRQFLSKGGRIVLVKSVLSSLPVFLLSSRLVMETVAFELEKLTKRFIRASKDGLKKFHLVAWEILCIPIDRGGLGLKGIRETNIEQLCKWFWCIHDNQMWVRILEDKYGTTGDIFFPLHGRSLVRYSI